MYRWNICFRKFKTISPREANNLTNGFQYKKGQCSLYCSSRTSQGFPNVPTYLLVPNKHGCKSIHSLFCKMTCILLLPMYFVDCIVLVNMAGNGILRKCFIAVYFLNAVVSFIVHVIITQIRRVFILGLFLISLFSDKKKHN